MAFATKLANRESELDKCKPIVEESKYRDNYQKLREMLKPPVREVILSRGERKVKIGGELVMYRHEFTYRNPTAIAIDVSDDMPDEVLMERLKGIEGFSYTYIGRELKLDLVAVRSVSNEPEKFKNTVEKVLRNTSLPLILCSFNPEVIKAGLSVIQDGKPLIYAATRDNWKEMADLALMYNCPLAVSSPNDLSMLKSLTKTLIEYGIENLVLDPGVFPDEGLLDTINNFTMLRKAVFKGGDEVLGFPLLGVPLATWLGEGRPVEKKWKEAYIASMLIPRFADVLIIHSLDGWVLLPLVILRDNIYTDPRKPVAVEPGIRVFGNPDKNSPVMFTTNFALTYYTVAADIQSGKIDCYLLVVDTEGVSVESAVAGRKLTADKVAEAIEESKVEERVNHKTIIIPGRASRLSGEIEEKSGWEVLVGPMDSSGIPKFIAEKWHSK